MLKLNKVLITTVVTTVTLLGFYKILSAEYLPLPLIQTPEAPVFQYARPVLWQYLRIGLNYLESPQPLSLPETVNPSYVHPDLKGFGPYGFSPAAYEDVQRVYPFFKQYGWQDLMRSHKLYDLANQAFADWLLKNLEDYIPAGSTQEEVFDVLHQAWNVGLCGFKNGNKVVLSRMRRAEEFKQGLVTVE